MKKPIGKALSALLALCLLFAVSACGTEPYAPEPSAPAPVSEETPPEGAEKTALFLNLTVETPDGTVYESADDGETWFINGEPAEEPGLSVTYAGGLPALLSEKITLRVVNNTGESLSYSDGYRLLREENGEWVEALLANGNSLAELQTLNAFPNGMKMTFRLSLADYQPIAGKYRYVRAFGDADGKPAYTVTLDFPVSAAETAADE